MARPPHRLVVAAAAARGFEAMAHPPQTSLAAGDAVTVLHGTEWHPATLRSIAADATATVDWADDTTYTQGVPLAEIRRRLTGQANSPPVPGSVMTTVFPIQAKEYFGVLKHLDAGGRHSFITCPDSD